MPESQQALMIEEGSDVCDQQAQIPQRSRLTPVAMVVAVAVAASLALFGGVVGPSKPLASNPNEFLEAVEDTPEQRAKQAIADLDKDSNGKISLQEWCADDAIFNAKGPEYNDIKVEFDGIDKDKDGKLDLSEMVAVESHPQDPQDHQATPEQMAKERLTDLDRDKDGMLNFQEFHDDDASFDKKGDQYKAAKSQFEGLDKDGNGKLDLDEFTASMKPSTGEGHGGDGGHEVPGTGPKYVEEEASVAPSGCGRSVAHPTAQLITKEAECRAAAKEMGYTFNKVGSWKDGYAGCMVQFCGKCQTKKKVILNTLPDDTSREVTWSADKTTDEWYNQVCIVPKDEEHLEVPP